MTSHDTACALLQYHLYLTRHQITSLPHGLRSLGRLTCISLSRMRGEMQKWSPEHRDPFHSVGTERQRERWRVLSATGKILREGRETERDVCLFVVVVRCLFVSLTSSCMVSARQRSMVAERCFLLFSRTKILL